MEFILWRMCYESFQKYSKRLLAETIALSIVAVPMAVVNAGSNFNSTGAAYGLENTLKSTDYDGNEPTDGFSFEVSYGTGTASLTKYSGTAKNITIPNKIKGYTVASIEKCAFEYCSSLTIYGAKGSIAEKYANENGITFKVIIPLTNNSTISATNIKAGTAITLNAKATGGTAPYKYYYYCKALNSTKYVQIKTDETATSRTTKPTVKGTYYYSVKVVDANGNFKIKIFAVNVK